MIATEDIEARFQEFETWLKNHDWYYQNSDDHSRWRNGDRIAGKIKVATETLLAVDEDRATALIRKYNPFYRDK